MDTILNESKELPQSLIVTKTPSDEVAMRDFKNRLSKAISSIPKKHRQILIMYAGEDMSYLKISKQLDIPMGTIMSSLFQSRGQLKSFQNEAVEEKFYEKAK